MTRRVPVAVLLLLVTVLSAQAQSLSFTGNVTLKADNATLHQLLLKLKEQTGMSFVGVDGAGDAKYVDPADAPRASVDLKDVPLGLALRRIAGQFKSTVRKDESTTFRFTPSDEVEPSGQVREGFRFNISQAHRQDRFRIIPASGEVVKERRVEVILGVRAEDGIGDVIGLITQISATDSHGKTLPVLGVIRRSILDMPDETTFIAFLYDPPADLRELATLDGVLGVMSRRHEVQCVIPLPKQGERFSLPIERQFGSIRVKITKMTLARNGIDVSLILSANADADFGNLQSRDKSALVRGPEHVAGPLSFRQKWSTFATGGGYVVVDGFRLTQGWPEALELNVPVRDGIVRRVPFHFEKVTIPPVRTEPLQLQNVTQAAPNVEQEAAPGAFNDPKGGSLRFPPLALSDQHGMRLAIGLSRKEADGTWSTLRWMERDAYFDPVLVRSLAAGTYRVNVRGAIIQAQGASGILKSLGSVEVTVQPGKEAQLPLPPAEPDQGSGKEPLPVSSR